MPFFLGASEKDVKRFADRALKRLLRDGASPTFELMLESLSAGDGHRDWNQLAASLHKGSGGEARQSGQLPRPPAGISKISVNWKLDDRGHVAAWSEGSRVKTTGEVSTLDLIYAPPGYGKSTLLNVLNLNACLEPQSNLYATLPRISIIDVGPSSSGLISLIREALPPHRRHEAVYERLRMAADHAINPFDTQVGLRKPLPHERAFLVNLLNLLCMPVWGTPHEGMAHLAASVIDGVYRIYGDDTASGTPKLYARGVDRLIDQKIREHNLSLGEDPTWWDVVDGFVDLGQFRLAEFAQRYAVPSLSDTLLAARYPAIQDMYGAARVADTNETLVQAFQRCIATAVQNYPLLGGPTRFDIGDARVCVLDIDEAAALGGDDGRRQTAVAYMLARHALTRDFFLHASYERLFPAPVRRHHLRRIKELSECRKRLVYDEYHRASVPAVRKQILVDIREGRKFDVQIALASQWIEDFDPDINDAASSVWICGVGGMSSGAEKVCTTFGLGPAVSHAIQLELRGPRAEGSPCLWISDFRDTQGMVRKGERLVVNKLDAELLWALSTTLENVRLRERLYSQVGSVEALRILAQAFPNGSAKRLVEQRMHEIAREGHDTSEHRWPVIDEIVKELVGKHPSRKPAIA